MKKRKPKQLDDARVPLALYSDVEADEYLPSEDDELWCRTEEGRAALDAAASAGEANPSPEIREMFVAQELRVFIDLEDRSVEHALPRLLGTLRHCSNPSHRLLADLFEPKKLGWQLELKWRGKGAGKKHSSISVIHMAWAYKALKDKLEANGEKKPHDKACAILSKRYGLKGQAFSAMVLRAWRDKAPC